MHCPMCGKGICRDTPVCIAYWKQQEEKERHWAAESAYRREQAQKRKEQAEKKT